MLKNASTFYRLLLLKFPFTPTDSQNRLLRELADFIFDDDKNSLFLLKGYAGTGKTTSISTFVNTLWQVGLKSVLLAPTGRAAKVISAYSGRHAFTIHKKIYFPAKTASGGIRFTLQQNKHTRTLFIVDEASMLPDVNGNNFYGQGSLLSDLIDYVYSGQHCKLILIGDTAQLPPVNLDVSPALNRRVLENRFFKKVYETELDEVMRQHSDSGILKNATVLRQLIASGNSVDFRFDLNYPDIFRLVEGDEILDALYDTFDGGQIEDTVFIVRSNKRANLYNQQIRNRILDRESEISTGDFIMIVKNNYYWLEDSAEVGFIANGDICEILEIYRFIDLYGFHFAEVKLRMVDYPKQVPFDTVLMLDTLHSESPALSQEEANRLFQEVSEDYTDLGAKYKILQAVKSNKYFNALQIKFAYAITCHKSQGGQWKNVFIEQPFLPDGPDISYLRWLYTAITRTQEKLFLIGFKDAYFEDSF